MEPNRALARASYLIAAYWFVSSLTDVITRAWPMHPGDPRWRFQILGAFSDGTTLPAIALFLAMGTAVWLRQPRARRFVGAVSLVFAAVVVVLACFFAIDYANVKGTLPAAVQRGATVATSMAVIKYLAAIVAFALMGLAGFVKRKPALAPAAATR